MWLKKEWPKTFDTNGSNFIRSTTKIPSENNDIQSDEKNIRFFHSVLKNDLNVYGQRNIDLFVICPLFC